MQSSEIAVSCGAKGKLVLANLGRLGIRDVMFSSVSKDS
jgi:hypothetical protein